jgi:SAM-dependent methyltransferase
MFDLSQLAGRLSCPDDGRLLRFNEYHFACDDCGRQFPVLRSRMLELLPSAPTNLGSQANANWRRSYEQTFHRLLSPRDPALPWGAPEVQPEVWLRKRRRQVTAILPLLSCGQDTSDLLLCDVSAGAGLYTLSYAAHFRGVLHCDLDPGSLAYALKAAERQGFNNVVFLRIDYLCPPFRKVLDRVLCLDSLIRGPAHERSLLRSLCGMLASGGRAVVDFHNWWHNPARRLGLLPQNFIGGSSYTRRAANRMLASLGIPATHYFGFVQEIEAGDDRYKRLGRSFLPATRLVYTLAPPLGG